MPVTHDEVVVEVRRAISSKIGDDVELTEGTRLIVDISLDSVTLMDLVADLEDRFRLTLSSEDLANITTLGDVVRTIEARLRSVASADPHDIAE